MASQGLTVAVTGPTGDLGIAIVDALERSRAVKRVVGMARRPFDPAGQGWKKTEYRQGDVQDAGSVRDTVKGADVLVHLAFSLMGAGDRTRAINVDGSRIAFEAAAHAGVQRICYASSVAAYGFHADNPLWLTEEVPARGTDEHFYSAQKAEVEQVLGEVMLRHQGIGAYVFRPCIVAGPRAQMLLEEMPYYRLDGSVPGPVVSLLASMPMLKPVIPDPGHRIQLVHEDDVAAAFVAGVRGVGAPGPYNLAGGGSITMSDIASELGWYALPVPGMLVDATAEVIDRLPMTPEAISWIHAARRPILMKVNRAKTDLKWKPEYGARATLKLMVERHRAAAPPAR